ncbi:MAG: M48 family metallopeptidase [Scytonematopsis contorta HA4267-MV1]|nr:M48 family metallopeptidase [Scytonematopsis contorta HA4267-MV1]
MKLTIPQLNTVLTIGETSIPYTVRYSHRSKHQRIVVTPKNVEVVAPNNTPFEEIIDFVESKRHWVFNAVEKCRSRNPLNNSSNNPQYYTNGIKVAYRGEQLVLQIEETDVDKVIINFTTYFDVKVPCGLTEEEKQEAIKKALINWKKDRVLQDILHFAKIYASKLNVKLADIKLSEQKRAWGSCAKNGTIRINWLLVEAPLTALEYVVAHEVVHLLHRHHQSAFWETLGTVMSDFKERKACLKSWETGSLS